MNCPNCKNKAVKAGRQTDGTQRYKCKHCGKSFQENYSYKAYGEETDQWITNLKKEGVSIRGIARLLNISKGTITRRLKALEEKESEK